MKKYKTTKKHPELKEGIEFFKRYHEDEEYMSESDTLLMLTDDIKICLEKGWIKEIKETGCPGWSKIGKNCKWHDLSKNGCFHCEHHKKFLEQ